MMIGLFPRPLNSLEDDGASAAVTTTRAGKCRMFVRTTPLPIKAGPPIAIAVTPGRRLEMRILRSPASSP